MLCCWASNVVLDSHVTRHTALSVGQHARSAVQCRLDYTRGCFEEKMPCSVILIILFQRSIKKTTVCAILTYHVTRTVDIVNTPSSIEGAPPKKKCSKRGLLSFYKC